jgi:hypothetical protein
MYRNRKEACDELVRMFKAKEPCCCSSGQREHPGRLQQYAPVRPGNRTTHVAGRQPFNGGLPARRIFA